MYRAPRPDVSRDADNSVRGSFPAAVSVFSHLLRTQLLFVALQQPRNGGRRLWVRRAVRWSPKSPGPKDSRPVWSVLRDARGRTRYEETPKAPSRAPAQHRALRNPQNLFAARGGTRRRRFFRRTGGSLCLGVRKAVFLLKTVPRRLLRWVKPDELNGTGLKTPGGTGRGAGNSGRGAGSAGAARTRRHGLGQRGRKPRGDAKTRSFLQTPRERDRPRGRAAPPGRRKRPLHGFLLEPPQKRYSQQNPAGLAVDPAHGVVVGDGFFPEVYDLQREFGS